MLKGRKTPIPRAPSFIFRISFFILYFFPIYLFKLSYNCYGASALAALTRKIRALSRLMQHECGLNQSDGRGRTMSVSCIGAECRKTPIPPAPVCLYGCLSV